MRARPGDLPWFSEYVFDQTRPFRALKLWATIAAAGSDQIRQRIVQGNAQARRLAEQIRRTAELELCAEPSLNIVVFRYADGDDDLNARIPVELQRAGEIFLIGTRVAGREAIRACFMHEATTDDDVDRIIPAVLDAAHAML